MSANRIFLVCSHHKSLNDAMLLCERVDASATYEPPNLKRLSEWLQTHSKCGNPDDFQLAFHRPQNWDVSPPAIDSVPGAVKLAIALGEGGNKQ